MLDNLKIGITIVQILTVCNLVAFIVVLIKRGREKKEKEILNNIFTPGFLIYALLFTFNVFITQNRLFEDYDEFSHWGLVAKNMFEYGTYGVNPESVVVYNDYPPFTATFQYLFLGVGRIFREDVVIMAQNTLYLSIIIPITKSLRWNIKGWTRTVLLIVFTPMIFYKNFFLEILVDGIMGVMFAYTIYSAFQKEDIRIKCINILTGLIMLSLTKTTGIALAILAVVIIVIGEIIENRYSKEKLKKELKLFWVVILIAILICGIWYIKIKTVEKKWDFKQLSVEENDRDEKEVTKDFIKTLFTIQNITERYLTGGTTILLLIAVTLIVDKKLKNKNYRYYGISMLISIPIYLAGMLMIYLRIFDVMEASFMACFDRYINTIFLAVTMFQVYVISENNEYSLRENIVISIILLVLIPQSNISQKYINGRSYIKKAETTRSVHTKIKNYKEILEIDDRILYIAGIEAVGKYLIVQNNYEIMPNKLTTVVMGNFTSQQELEDIAKEHDYIFIYRMEDETKEIIKGAFENELVIMDTLYKVNINENNIEFNLIRQK